MKKMLATAALLALGWGLKFGYNVITAEPYVEPTAAEWAAEDDAWVEESLRDGSAEPARGWLDTSGHGTFEGDPTTMNDFIEELSAAGAEQIWMIDIVEFGGRRISDTIAVALPASGLARERILAAEAAFWGDPPREDVGQRYITVSFD